MGYVPDNVVRRATKYLGAHVANTQDIPVQEMASELIKYCAELFSLEHFEGLLEHSGSTSNERALLLARKKTGKSLVLTTNLTHSSIANACEKLGMKPLVVDADPDHNWQVGEDQVKEIIERHGDNIATVVSTFGTAQLGNLERLAFNPSVKQLVEQGAWLHVDAAYGGMIGNLQSDYSFIPSYSPLWTAPTRAWKRKERVPPYTNSITLDPYKFVGLPGCSVLLLNPETQIKSEEVPYYQLSPFTRCTTLSAFPLAVIVQTLRDYGRETLRIAASDCRDTAKWLAQSLQQEGLNIILPVETNMVPIAFDSQSKAEDIRKKLEERGYQVGSVHLQGDRYNMYGIRIHVGTKDPEIRSQKVSSLFDATKKVWRETA